MIFTNIKYIIVHVVFSIFSQKMYEIIQYYVSFLNYTSSPMQMENVDVLITCMKGLS
jgi:hypothetical protein